MFSIFRVRNNFVFCNFKERNLYEPNGEGIKAGEDNFGLLRPFVVSLTSGQ